MHKTKMMKKLFMTALMVAASVGLTNAQTAQKQIVLSYPQYRFYLLHQ